MINSVLYAASFLLIAVSCSKSDGNSPSQIANEENTPADELTVLQFAESVDLLSTFVQAVKESDIELLNVVSSVSQKTLFIPTNDAFKTFLSDLEGYEILQDFEQGMLAELLKYHIVDGTAAFSDVLSNGKVLETFQSEELTIKVDANIFLQDKTEEVSKVQRADNDAKDGVVHIIDKVLVPQSVLDELFPRPNLFELIEADEDLELFEQAISKADMTSDFNAEGPLTIFAPSNVAINQLFEILGEDYETFDDFDNVIEVQILKELILGHMVSERIESMDFVEGTLTTMLPGDSIELIAFEDTFIIRDATALDARLLSVDDEASNGIMHTIDKILIPQRIKEFID